MMLYDHIIGTGGIGSGMVFSLSGDHTLGRNESRPGRLEPYRDYCKLHIVMHYLAVLLGADPSGNFRLYPIGGVGPDDTGSKLLAQMAQAGMDTKYIRVYADVRTLFSVCYQYPDHSGGNITTENSASSRVSEDDIDDFFRAFGKGRGKGMVLALPEVPVGTRLRLLYQGRKRGYLTAASVLSAEAAEFCAGGGLAWTDLLAVNMYEALSIAGLEDESLPPETIVSRSIERLRQSNPGIRVLITDGAGGSYGYGDGGIQHHPVIPAGVISTAGAGDAFLAGTLAGLCRGLPLFTREPVHNYEKTPLRSAADLGTLIASMSVTSPDTIHMGINAGSLRDFALARGLSLSQEFETALAPG